MARVEESIEVELPEVQGQASRIPLSLERVGVLDVKMPIAFMDFEGKLVSVVPSFDAFIDLPANLMGIHASRSYEVITEALGTYSGKPFKLEELCIEASRELLRRHEYASRSEVRAKGEAVISKLTPKSGAKTFETCDIYASAASRRNGSRILVERRRLGVGVMGLTACPCGKELVKSLALKSLKSHGMPEDLADKLDELPLATHMQRSYGSILLDSPRPFSIDAMKLVDIIERSMSSPTYGLLKREDEAEVIVRSVSNPRFSEDVIRYMMAYLKGESDKIPGEAIATFSVRSLESIHKHDFYAEKSIKLKDIDLKP
ncbi:MAG: GTP cyclohydrolase MptA [Candidatus Bathyarchaeia archaeon]